MISSNILSRKILFISHDASLTGAPILLLNLIRLLQEKGYKEHKTILARDGALADEFRKLNPTFIYKSSRYGKRKYFVHKVFDYLLLLIRRIKLARFVRGYDVLLCNTIANGSLLKILARKEIKVILYVHELNSVIEEFNTELDASYSMNRANVIACPSQIVAKNLVKHHSVDARKISLLRYYFPYPQHLFQTDNKAYFRKVFSEKYLLPLDGFWVVGMGTATLRKGIDLFVEVCVKATAKSPNTFFVWIGDFVSQSLKNQIERRVAELNLNGKILFTGQINHSIANLLPFDILALTSREDPYPLVVLEAAYNKIPCLCFEESGGIVEFVENDCGWILQEFSAEEMAQKIVDLQSDQKSIRESGENAFRKAISWHSNPDKIVEQFEKLL